MTTPQSYANYCEERKIITVFIVCFNIFHYFRTIKIQFEMKKILIVGAGGQIGSELVPYLRGIYGAENVVATDVRECKGLGDDGPFEVLDALNPTNMAKKRLMSRFGVGLLKLIFNAAFYFGLVFLTIRLTKNSLFSTKNNNLLYRSSCRFSIFLIS